jgi:mannose-6-phosphate isomerase-like protein (cupin superfamily)
MVTIGYYIARTYVRQLGTGEQTVAIVWAAQAPHFDLDGFHFLGLTSPSRGATELCTWRLDLEPGAESDLHKLNREEVFIVLEGAVSVTRDGEEEVELHTGDACAIPACRLFRVANRTHEVARAIVCIAANFNGAYADGRETGTPPWAQ